MHIIYDGRDLYAMGVKVEKIIGKEPPVIQGFLQLDPLSRTLLIQNPRNPEERLYNWRLTKPGLVRVQPSNPRPRWQPMKPPEVNQAILEMKAFWADKEKACRMGMSRAIAEVDALGFHFYDDSLLRWEGRVNPSPIKGWNCFASVWGGGMPCGVWHVGQMPRDLEKRLSWLSSNRLAGKGKESRVELDPVLLLEDRRDLFVYQTEQTESGRTIAYSIATKAMLQEVQAAADVEEETTGDPAVEQDHLKAS